MVFVDSPDLKGYPLDTAPFDPEQTVNEGAENFYWVGKVAAFGTVVHPELWDGLQRLRGRVYVHERNFLPEGAIDENGREVDEDDDRSINFAIVEYAPQTTPDVVGSGRLIVKSDDTPLPIERYFPEIFADSPAVPMSTEASRFIASHESKKQQHRIAMAALRALSLVSAEKQMVVDYCMIEEPLIRLLGKVGLPMVVLGKPKQVDELGGELYPVAIDPSMIVSSLHDGEQGSIQYRSFFSSAVSTSGTGLFPATLMGRDL